MDRTELLNAMRVIKDHCSTIQLDSEVDFVGTCNDKCPIGEECALYLESEVLPEDWNLDGGNND